MQTPYEQASKLAREFGDGKSKTWRAGFRDRLLGLPRPSGDYRDSVGQMIAYGMGASAAQSIFDCDGPGESVDAMVHASQFDGCSIRDAIKLLHSSMDQIFLNISIAAHDRAVREYQEHVARRGDAE